MSSLKVKTIGYYHRYKDMKIDIGKLPKQLNAFAQSLPCTRKVLHQEIDLNYWVEDLCGIELYLESLLNYIKQEGWPDNKKTKFVTNRHLLKVIAASGQSKVVAVKRDDVIYMVDVILTEPKIVDKLNYGAGTEHICTRQEKYENYRDEEVVRKTVLLAKIEDFEVLYSGQVDAIDKNGEHVEIKSYTKDGRFEFPLTFWSNVSSPFYWKSVFGNVETMIFGFRTSGYHKGYLIEMEKMSTDSFREKMEKSTGKIEDCEQFNYEEGLDRVKQFLRKIENLLIEDNSSVVLHKEEGSDEWIVEDMTFNGNSEEISRLKQAVSTRM